MSDPCIKTDLFNSLRNDINLVNQRLNSHSEKMDLMHDDHLNLAKNTAVMQELVSNQTKFIENVVSTNEASRKEQAEVNASIKDTLVKIQQALMESAFQAKDLANTDEILKKSDEEIKKRLDENEEEIKKRLDEIDEKSKFDILLFIRTTAVPALLGGGAFYAIIEIVRMFL
jgi:flagellar motility protein MotE (MotC chaperone)